MRKKNKMLEMRLGLVTPQSASDVVDLNPFFPAHEAASSDEQDSTTCCSSPEHPPAASDEEELLSSVIGSLGLDGTQSCPTHQMLEPMSPPTRSSEMFLTGPKAPPNTPSQGSMPHAAGSCKPCAWFWKPSGCRHATNCAYCHVCSEGELKARKKSKHTAMRLGLVTPKATPTLEQEVKYALNLAAFI